jgi:hypothetical protein
MVALWMKILILDVSPCSMVGKYNILDESTASILHKKKPIGIQTFLGLKYLET